MIFGVGKALKVSSQKFCFVLFVVRICLFACLFVFQMEYHTGALFQPLKIKFKQGCRTENIHWKYTLFLRSFKRRFPKRVHWCGLTFAIFHILPYCDKNK